MTAFRAVLVAVGLAAGLAHAGIEGAKLYSGPEGMKLTIVRLSGTPSILIYVQGSDSRYDGKALPFTLEEEGDRLRYGTQVGGRDFYPFHVNVERGGKRTYTFYPGGNHREVSVVFDEKGTQSLHPEEVVKRYEEQKRDGTLDKFMAFDRPGEQKQAEEGLASQLKATQARCGFAVPLSVQWTSIDDETLKGYSIASYCGPPLEALEDLCALPSVRELLKGRVQSVECSFGVQVGLTLEEGVARWSTATSGSNLKDAAKKGFRDALGGGAPNGPAWGQGKTLRELESIDQTAVCTDGKRYFAVLEPGEYRGARLYSGMDRALVEAREAPWGLSEGTFLDPRFPNPTANPNFRGADMRVYSNLEVNRDAARCELRCGTRKLALELLTPSRAREVLVGAKVEPNPQQYGPHALLRDELGRYYYIDKGIRPDNTKSFRVFIGNKGKLEPQRLTNLVADSEGEVFSTKTGELRLVIDRSEGSSWVQSGKHVKLRSVPVEENLPLIYNELGVYQGARLGTPCDDAPL